MAFGPPGTHIILGTANDDVLTGTDGDDCIVAFGGQAASTCLGRRMNEGAANLVDYVLPEVPIRQWVLRMPHRLRFPLAFEGRGPAQKRATVRPTAFIARLAALVPPPRRHVIRYFGVLSSHSTLRPNVVPSPPGSAAGPEPHSEPTADRAGRRRRYIPWAELLRRTFAIDVVCQGCGGNLPLIALVKAEETISKILNAMGLPAEPPLVSAARPPPQQSLWTSPRP
ncbi:MAG: transposase [Myxococcales bacterium]